MALIERCADMSSVIGSFASKDILVERRAPGSYVKGRYTPGAITQLRPKCSVQPLSGRELENLPQGLRSRSSIKIYSTIELETVEVSDSSIPDTVHWHGRKYEVQIVEDWSEHANYWKCIAVMEGQG